MEIILKCQCLQQRQLTLGGGLEKVVLLTLQHTYLVSMVFCRLAEDALTTSASTGEASRRLLTLTRTRLGFETPSISKLAIVSQSPSFPLNSCLKLRGLASRKPLLCPELRSRSSTSVSSGGSEGFTQNSCGIR